MPIRFHPDEHICASIAAGLRRRGVDLKTCAEAGLIAAGDAGQLSFAAAAGRVLVSHDADFLRLHAEGVVRAGIAWCPQGSLSIGEMLRSLVLIHDLLSADEIAGKVEFL